MNNTRSCLGKADRVELFTGYPFRWRAMGKDSDMFIPLLRDQVGGHYVESVKLGGVVDVIFVYFELLLMTVIQHRQLKLKRGL